MGTQCTEGERMRHLRIRKCAVPCTAREQGDQGCRRIDWVGKGSVPSWRYCEKACAGIRAAVFVHGLRMCGEAADLVRVRIGLRIGPQILHVVCELVNMRCTAPLNRSDAF
jgi:hypothetical protein